MPFRLGDGRQLLNSSRILLFAYKEGNRGKVINKHSRGQLAQCGNRDCG